GHVSMFRPGKIELWDAELHSVVASDVIDHNRFHARMFRNESIACLGECWIQGHDRTSSRQCSENCDRKLRAIGEKDADRLTVGDDGGDPARKFQRADVDLAICEATLPIVDRSPAALASGNTCKNIKDITIEVECHG